MNHGRSPGSMSVHAKSLRGRARQRRAGDPFLLACSWLFRLLAYLMLPVGGFFTVRVLGSPVSGESILWACLVAGLTTCIALVLFFFARLGAAVRELGEESRRSAPSSDSGPSS